jgi:hypothetical protein
MYAITEQPATQGDMWQASSWPVKSPVHWQLPIIQIADRQGRGGSHLRPGGSASARQSIFRHKAVYAMIL